LLMKVNRCGNGGKESRKISQAGCHDRLSLPSETGCS
jgi:hypothetical protein